MQDKLARLLYYYFTLDYSGNPIVAGGRATRILVGLEDAPAKDAWLAWAMGAYAALERLVQPGYIPEESILISQESSAPLWDLTAYTLPWGAAASLVFNRDVCAPENVAARLISEKILEVVKSTSLANNIKRLIERTWLRLVARCGTTHNEQVLVNARKRIVYGIAPPRYRSLVPYIDALLEGGPGAGRVKGLIHLDKLAEFITLASILSFFDINVDLESYRKRVFSGRGLLVCYEPLIDTGGSCKRRPDIVVISRDKVILIEVKSPTRSERIERTVTSAIHQLLLYEALLRRGAILRNTTGELCTISDISTIIYNIVAVLAGRKMRLSRRLRLSKKCIEEAGIYVTKAERTGKVVSRILSSL